MDLRWERCRNNDREDLSNGYVCSFRPKDPPSGLHAKYKVLKEKHNKRVLKAFVISLTSIIVGSALTLFFTSFLAILFPIFFLVAPTLSYAKIVAGDIEFYEAKEEAEWYGIE